MPEYFYTVDMGEVFGPRLEKLAAEAGADDVEDFARALLVMAIELRERSQGLETEAAARDAQAFAARPPDGPGRGLDDDLPF